MDVPTMKILIGAPLASHLGQKSGLILWYQVRLFSLGSQNAKFVLEASQVPPYHKDLALDFT